MAKGVILESFNGHLRDEHLRTELFFSVADAQPKLLEWQRGYNEVRPHNSLGQLPPREFVAAWQFTRAARGEILNLKTVWVFGAGPYEGGTIMHRKHLWVFICSLLLIPTLGWSDEGSDKDTDALRACLRNWGKHPFVEGNLEYRTIAPSVRVFGTGVSVQDNRATEQPELVLVKPSVSVFARSTIRLLNPRGWYCLKGKVAVFSEVDLQIDCRANLASSSDGATVMGGNDRRDGVTVFGNSNVTQIGCDKTN